MYVGPGKCILHIAVLISIFHVKAQERDRGRTKSGGCDSCALPLALVLVPVIESVSPIGSSLSLSVVRIRAPPPLSLSPSLSFSLSLSSSLSQVSSWLLPSCVIGVMGEPALIGEMGWSTRPETSTWSPTRKTAPLGPAHAYWPNTGLSA